MQNDDITLYISLKYEEKYCVRRFVCNAEIPVPSSPSAFEVYPVLLDNKGEGREGGCGRSMVYQRYCQVFQAFSQADVVGFPQSLLIM